MTVQTFLFLLFAIVFWPAPVAATEVVAKAATADYLVSLVRHGDRSPRDLGDMAGYWPMGPGQLTIEGFEQEYLLGKKIRSHYFSETLPEAWSPKVSLHLAKGLDRTIQSASALLQGVYPGQRGRTGLPGGIQVPPVYATPLASDDLFSAQRLCPGYLSRLRALEASADWVQKKQQYRGRLEGWLAEQASKAIDDRELHALMPLIDQIAIHRLHRLPMPKGVSRQEAIELEDLLNWLVSRIFGNYEIAQLIGAPMAKAMIRDFRNVQQCLEQKESQCPRWTLYSGSDSNLLAMMTLLGAPSEKIVDYAAHLGVQLNWNRGQPRIVLSLNHEPFIVPGCAGHCSLEQWITLLERSLPEDWDRLCDRGPPALYPEPYVPDGSVASR